VADQLVRLPPRVQISVIAVAGRSWSQDPFDAAEKRRGVDAAILASRPGVRDVMVAEFEDQTGARSPVLTPTNAHEQLEVEDPINFRDVE
jgi:hypothetical protein